MEGFQDFLEENRERMKIAVCLAVIMDKSELGDRCCAYLPAVSDESLPHVMDAVAGLQRTPGGKPS